MLRIKALIISILFTLCALSTVALVACEDKNNIDNNSAYISNSGSDGDSSSTDQSISADPDGSSAQGDDSSSGQSGDSLSSQDDDSSSSQGDDSSSSQGDDSSSSQGDDSSSSQDDDSSSSQGDDSSSGQGGGGQTEDLPAKLTVLFQGDSITDNVRSRTDLTDLGGGYASMVAKALENAYGDSVEFTFINRANSGWNLIDDWNKGGVDHYEDEFYQYNADIATILIGYNDIMDSYSVGGVSDDEFRSCYDALLSGLKERGTTAICIAPFDIIQQNDYTRTEFPAKRAIIEELAEKYSFPFIDMKPFMLQAVEDGAYRMELFGDLTHPWAAGCRIISELVTDKISSLIDETYETPDNLGEYRSLSTVADNEDDLTNVRAFFATSHGKAEYDNEVFYSTDEFVSTQSLKVIHEDTNPNSANAYSKILFDFSSLGMQNISTGKLTFNIKFDNFIPWLSVRAYSALERSGANVSKEYGLNTTDVNKCQELGDGWYKVTINLYSWAEIDTTDVLKKAVAIVVTMSKGEDNSSRERFGVDGTKDSVFWIDNLVFDLSSDPDDVHAAQEPLTAGQSITKYVEERAYSTVYFEYKITSEANTFFSLCVLDKSWGSGIGYFMFNSAGTVYNYEGVSTFKDEEGYVHVTITIAEVTKAFGAGIPDTFSVLNIRGDNGWSTANGYFDKLKFTV